MLKSVSSVANAIGALNYKGTWNASTNTPNLLTISADKGDYYVVSVAGTTLLDGISTWYVGDWAVYNGSVWQRVEGGDDDPAPSVRSNSTTGVMEITGPAAGSTRVMTIPDANFTVLATTDIGVTVQAYDADTAKTDVAQTFTASQRGTVTTDNDGSFDMNATNNFICTPNAGFTLTFTNITAGQSGNIVLVNGSNYAIAAAATTKVAATTLATISATGTYWLSYYSPDGTNVYVANTAALA
jgi:hypothetical protein